MQLFERDGRFLVHDVNVRPPAPVALSIRAGLNLPALALEAALGRPWEPPRAPLRPFTYISRFDEMKGWKEDVRTLGVMAAARGGARHRGPGEGRTLVDPPWRDPLWIGQLARVVVRRLSSNLALPGS